MMRRLAIGVVGLGLALVWSAGAHAALSAAVRESTLDDVAPAAVAELEEAGLPGPARESLECEPRLKIPVPGFGEFGVPARGAEPPSDDGAPGLLQFREVDDGVGEMPEVQP